MNNITNNIFKIRIKKLFLLSIMFFSSFLYGNFLSNQVKNNIGSINSSSLQNLTRSSINSKYLNNILNMGNSSSLFSGSALSAFIGQNTFTSGTMEMCYNYIPNNQTNVSGNICSMFSNIHINANPCSALPNTIGNWHKKSFNNKSFTIGIKDFCNKLAGNTINQPLKAIVTQHQGFSALKQSNTQGSVFLNDKNNYVKKKDAATDKIIDKFNSKISPYDTKGEKTIKELAESQQEAVVLEKLSHIAKISNGDFTKADTNAMNKPTIAFNNYTEYSADVNSVATKNLTQDNSLLDFNTLLNTANMYFLKLNQQGKQIMNNMNWKDALSYQKTIFAKKMRWINSVVLKRLQSLNLLAYKKAKEEIVYTLPQKLGYYHVLFNKDVIRPKGDNLNLSKAAQTEVINTEIRRQEYYEVKIKVKWARWAKEKSIKLKNMLVKAAIASKFFPYNQVLEYVNQLIQ